MLQHINSNTYEGLFPFAQIVLCLWHRPGDGVPPPAQGVSWEASLQKLCYWWSLGVQNLRWHKHKSFNIHYLSITYDIYITSLFSHIPYVSLLLLFWPKDKLCALVSDYGLTAYRKEDFEALSNGFSCGDKYRMYCAPEVLLGSSSNMTPAADVYRCGWERNYKHLTLDCIFYSGFLDHIRI